VRATWQTEKLKEDAPSDIWKALGDDCHVWETIAAEIERQAPIRRELCSSSRGRENAVRQTRDRQMTISLMISHVTPQTMIRATMISRTLILRIRWILVDSENAAMRRSAAACAYSLQSRDLAAAFFVKMSNEAVPLIPRILGAESAVTKCPISWSVTS